jgi:hypothetical protein
VDHLSQPNDQKLAVGRKQRAIILLHFAAAMSAAFAAQCVMPYRLKGA